MKSQDKLILLGTLAFCAALVAMVFMWNANRYYSNAYSPVVEKSVQRNNALQSERDEAGGQSNQPRAAGFAEKEIEKQHGNRYATY